MHFSSYFRKLKVAIFLALKITIKVSCSKNKSILSCNMSNLLLERPYKCLCPTKQVMVPSLRQCQKRRLTGLLLLPQIGFIGRKKEYFKLQLKTFFIEYLIFFTKKEQKGNFFRFGWPQNRSIRRPNLGFIELAIIYVHSE